MITASMSTIAWREPGLAIAVASLLPQVDRLNVFLQGYDRAPSCLSHPKIAVVNGGADTVFGASAKYRWLWDDAVASGYHFAVDDDIEYPPDYVQHCIREIEEYGGRVVVGFHGAIFDERMVRYFSDRRTWSFDRANDADRFVHVLGTGTTAMRTDTLRLSRADFEQPNSCDLYLGIAAQKQRVPMLCLARPGGYLKALPLSADPRSASAPEEYARRMVEIHDSWTPWQIHTAERVAARRTPVVVVVPSYNEPLERIERTIASAFATPGVDLVRVVDDGSGIPVGLAPRDRLEVLRCLRNGGPSAALNAGIRSLPADAIICRLDVGDVFYPEPKARQIAMVKSGAPAVCSWRFDPVAGRVCPIREDWARRIYTDCQFSGTATVFTKAAWLECGGFDESLRWCDDWRFSVAVHAHIGWTVFPEVTGEHGEFPGGHSDVNGDRERRKLRNEHRARAAKMCAVLGSPDKYAHLFNEEWCRKRGVVPMKRPRR